MPEIFFFLKRNLATSANLTHRGKQANIASSGTLMATHSRMRVVRCCPKCDNLDVRRSHRKGLLETFLFPILLIRPYRCNQCKSRHLNFAFCRKVGKETNEIDVE